MFGIVERTVSFGCFQKRAVKIDAVKAEIKNEDDSVSQVGAGKKAGKAFSAEKQKMLHTERVGFD